MPRNAALAVLAVVGLAGPSSGRSESVLPRVLKISQITDAINRDICFDNFWYGGAYKLGSAIPLSVSVGRSNIDAWSDKLVNRSGIFTTHFALRLNNEKYFVTSSESYNKRYFDRVGQVDNKANITTLHVPSRCEPKLTTMSPKARLIQKIASLELKSINRIPGRINIRSFVIANADEFYPISLVYVLQTDELFTVSIDPGTSHFYNVEEHYLFGQINDKHHIATIRKKLLKYGIAVPVLLGLR